MKYPELMNLCKKCIGCNRLEDINFKGIYRCQYYTEEVRNEQILQQKNNNKYNHFFTAPYTIRET